MFFLFFFIYYCFLLLNYSNSAICCNIAMDADDENVEETVNKLQVHSTDGARMERLKLSLQCSLDRILSTWKPSQFAK